MITCDLSLCSGKQRFYFVVMLALLVAAVSEVQAANIFVTARPGSVGCDLIEAIESANTNSAVGGCAAGGVGLDTIRFFAGFTRYELPNIAFSNPAGSSGTPEISSEIRIIGPGAELLVIARPLGQGDIYRAFTVSVAGGNLTLENLSLQNFGQSEGFAGGAIRVAGSLTMSNVEIIDSSATFGGAIWVQGASATIRRSLIRNNRSLNGGGIGISSRSRVNVFDSTITDNHSDFGGGISLAVAPDSSLSLYNTTITGNSASVQGGGLSLFMAGTDTANSATIRNTIIAGNSAPVSREVHFVNPNGALELDIRNNLLGTGAHTYRESVNTQGFLTTGNLALTSDFLNTPLSAILKPLDDNGGKTMTHALAANSPAIDNGLQGVVSGGPSIFFSTPGCRGDFVTIGFGGDYRPDQRGIIRPQGSECDIGAYEYEPVDDVCYVVKAQNNNVVTFCL